MKFLPNNIDRVAEGGKRLNGTDHTYDDNQPLISIVMVVFNGAKFIEEALESIFSQKYNNLELIIIDGGSNDETVSIIYKYSHLIEYWVSEPDDGQSDAFNKGFSVCSGVLATWLNSDDLLVPNCIEKIAKIIKQSPNIKWLSGNLIMTDIEKNIIGCRLSEKGRSILTYFGILNVYGPSSFFSLEVFNAVGGMNTHLHYTMDTDLWWRFYKYGVELHRSKDYAFIFRFHENSKTSRYLVMHEEMNEFQTSEKKDMCDKYLKCDNKILKIVGRFINGILRVTSYHYVKGIFHSVYLRGKPVNILFKLLKY